MSLNLFIPIKKVDEAQRLVYGVATAEVVDKSGEICDYESTVPHYKEWSGEFEKNTDGKSLGNVRAMHGDVAAGKVTSIDFDDENKQILVCAKIIDDNEWKKVTEGVYTGFSQGGSYVKRWDDPTDPKVKRYTAKPVEISIVDNPCVGIATFEYIKADGAHEMRKFVTPAPDPKAIGKVLSQVWQCTDGSTHAEKRDAVRAQAKIDAEALAAPARAAIAKIDAEIAPAKKSAFEGIDFKPTLAKDVWDAACAMDALSSLNSVLCSESWEWGKEQDAGQIADLKAAIERIKSFIASEIMEDDAAKAAAAELEKKGARNSKDDSKHLTDIHAHASEIMDKCMKLGIGGGDDTAKNAGAAEGTALEKSAVEKEEALIKIEAENGALTKVIGDLTEQFAALQKRLAFVESQPLPGKGAIFAVGKGDEVSISGKDTPVPKQEKMTLSGLSPAEARRRSNSNGG